MIGIGVKRTSGGGGISVTTTYLGTYFDTLDAGYTPVGAGTSGTKYHATREKIELLAAQFSAAKELAATNVDVQDYNNIFVTITLDQFEKDLLELAINETQALIHYYA